MWRRAPINFSKNVSIVEGFLLLLVLLLLLCSVAGGFRDLIESFSSAGTEWALYYAWKRMRRWRK